MGWHWHWHGVAFNENACNRSSSRHGSSRTDDSYYFVPIFCMTRRDDRASRRSSRAVGPATIHAPASCQPESARGVIWKSWRTSAAPTSQASVAGSGMHAHVLVALRALARPLFLTPPLGCDSCGTYGAADAGLESSSGSGSSSVVFIFQKHERHGRRRYGHPCNATQRKVCNPTDRLQLPRAPAQWPAVGKAS